MSWFCHDPPFVFFHNPRTAGTSMIKTLRAQCDLRPYHAGVEVENYVADHSTDVHRDCRDYPTIAAVRNPFQRELSHYLWHRRHVAAGHPVQLAARFMLFPAYMDFMHRTNLRYYDDFHARMFGLQSRFFLRVGVTHTVRYENLQADFAGVTGRLFGKPVPLGHSSDTRSPAYCLQDHYDDETMELVQLYAGADFIKYGYDPNVLPKEK